MRRLNLKKQYAETVFKVQKFFLSKRHTFESDEILLLQTLKQEEGQVIKRVKGFMIFDKLLEDESNESEKLYGKRWRFLIYPKRTVKFDISTRFNLSEVMGPARAKKYDCQAEVVKLDPEDERAVLQKIPSFIPSACSNRADPTAR